MQYAKGGGLWQVTDSAVRCAEDPTSATPRIETIIGLEALEGQGLWAELASATIQRHFDDMGLPHIGVATVKVRRTYFTNHTTMPVETLIGLAARVLWLTIRPEPNSVLDVENGTGLIRRIGGVLIYREKPRVGNTLEIAASVGSAEDFTITGTVSIGCNDALVMQVLDLVVHL